MGARLALCLPLLLLATPPDLSAQVHGSWRDDVMAITPGSLPVPATIVSIALSMKSRPIQDSRCYLMNGGAVESFFISEDTPVGSVIGTLSINGDPSDEVGDVSLRVQEQGAAVALAPGSKNLTLLRPLDREQARGPSSVYVNVRCDRRRTTDPSFIIPVSVRVWDVNDNAPQWVGAPYRVRVSELAPPGARLLAPRALDRDQPGPHATLHYSVLPGAHSELVRFAHELESALVVGAALDYESVREFSVTLRAADGGAPPLHADARLAVEVLDADDQNPAFAHDHYSAVLAPDAVENTTLVTSPGPIAAADQDLGINAPLFYSVAGDGAQLVHVDRDSGRVRATARLAAITQPVTVVIKATQVDNADRYALATLSVSRAARAEGAEGAEGGAAGAEAGGARGVRFARREYRCVVSEAAAPGALLATLHTEPPPQGRLQFYVSERSFLDKFAINGAGEVVLRAPLDFEQAERYRYQVLVTDGVTNDTAALEIAVSDVNEWEPRFRFPQYSFLAAADAAGAAGGAARVGRLDVQDGDRADRVALSLHGPDASMLFLNASGELYLRAGALRGLNRSVLHVVATARDSGQPPRQSSVPVLVHVASAAPAGGGWTRAACGAAAVLLAGLLAAALLLLRRRRRSKPSPAPVSKPSIGPAKSRPPSPAAGPALPPASPLAAPPPRPPSGSLQSVSAGASTILANSSSSLDLRDSLPPSGTGGGSRSSRGKVAPLPPPGPALALMSDHLASGAGRSGVAWPSATIPARVKKLSWDDAARDSQDSGAADAADPARREHMNLTVYF